MQYERKDSTLIFKPEDNLVAAAVKRQLEEIKSKLSEEREYESVVLDLTEVSEVDSMGVNLVVGLCKHCQKAQVEFRVVGVSPEIKRLFALFK